MNFQDLLSIIGAILLALGGGAAIVLTLANWLGGLWAARILDKERLAGAREQELLVRRRNVYTKLSISLRVFLCSTVQTQAEDQKRFLEAYDEASLWAPDDVMSSIGVLLDLIRTNTASRGSVTEEELQAAYAACITAMRKDCGFPNTEFNYRVVAF